MLQEIHKRGWKTDAIGGLTMGADPIVVATSVISAQYGKPINGFLVRKAEKTHGTGQRIEGFREKRARVVIVDDVCTTGASTIQAIEAARDYGFDIVGVMCLVDREQETGARILKKPRHPRRSLLCSLPTRFARNNKVRASREIGHASDLCSECEVRLLRPSGGDEYAGQSL